MNWWSGISLAALITLAAAGTAVAQVKDAEKALKNNSYDEALRFVENALAEKPGDSKALELKGAILRAKASAELDLEEHALLLEQMVEVYAAVAASEPKRADKLKKEITLAYLDEVQSGFRAYTAAQQSGKEGDYVTAAAYFRGAAALAPDSTDAYLNWAFSLMNAGRSAEAIQPLEGALGRGVRDADAIKYLSTLYMANGRADDAVTLLEKSTEEFPDNQSLTTQLLNVYALSGQTDRAAEYYVRAIAANPTRKIYRYNYGALLLEAERYDEAIEQLTAAVELDPDYADAQYNLGAAYVNKAISVNEEITRLDDQMRSSRGELSSDEIAELEATTSELTTQRGELFEMAIAPLEKAKALYESAGKDVEAMCQLLFQSYVQASQMEKAAGVQECAGYE